MASTSEYEQQQFWNKSELIRLDIGKYKVILGHQLLEDIMLYGQCAYKISNSGIERIHPLKIITNGNK